MALKQGATYEEIEELLLFMCVYAGFNKVASYFNTLKEIFKQSGDEKMISAMRKEDYSIRDRKGQVGFYVLLWKRQGISLELFDDYWRNVHGPLCARLPGQYQNWQFHLSRNEGGIWPIIDGIGYTCLDEEQFDGIAELTFETETDRQSFFQSSGILMADEHNLFSKAITYNTSFGNCKTYIDRIPIGEPNGELGVIKFHVMVKKSDAVSVEAFHRYMTDTFVPVVVQSDSVIKLRLHLLEEVDNSRPDDDGVVRYELLDKQYQAAFEIAFANPLEMEAFFASKQYKTAVKDLALYIKQFLPFPERSAYTFVYDGKMTLAGQCSSKVADLIVKVGATNQLKKDTVDLMNGEQNLKSGLGSYLQGMQHVGVTVSDMAKSLEFYTEVLGGKLVISEDGLVGDRMQNTLFQKEELDAIAQGIDLNNLDIPNLKDALDALDIQFISFGNACIELIYFRDAARSNKENSSVGSIPSHIGHVNAMHISFHVKEDLDLNVFAQMLEAECQKRGLTNVVCNRVIRVKSEAERKQVARKYNSAKFWNEPELLAEGEPETDFGEFEGWALFYCKGPNGEQLEFNQATRKVKTHFEQAREEYNMANHTFFSDSKLSSPYSMQIGDKSEIIHAKFSSPVNASLSTVWQVLLDKIENPGRYNLEAKNYRILERHHNQVLREMKVLNMTIEEIITWDEATKQIRHTLVNNPLFIGQSVNTVIPPASHDPNAQPIITFSLDWEPYNEEGRQVVPEIRGKIAQAVEQAVLNSKTIAEQQAESPSAIANGKIAKIKNGSKPSIENLPGKTTDMVKRLFSRGEAFDIEGFLTFFTDTPVYQFGDFEVCLDKAVIKQSADAFFSRISAVYHDIKMMWEVGDVVFVEMDVTYWRKDGSVITLPCFDIFRVEGDKFSELRIFMDVNPVFDPTISVPDNASVFTMSKGNILDSPNIMKKHFAEHPEGIKRLETGFAPKWSINGDNSFNSQIAKSASKVDIVMEMEAAGGNHDWEYFKTFFVDNVYFKVGSSQEKRGYQAIRDYLIWLYKVAEPKLPFEFRGTWEIGDVVIIEMNAKYTRRSDGKLMIFPCTDILRFEGNKIREWRVYPDQSELWMTEKVKFHGPRTYR